MWYKKDNKTEVFEQTYEENLNLILLYEILDKLYNSKNVKKYPDDIQNKLNDLINSLNNYVYHSKGGYDIINENYFSKVTYRKN